MNALNKEILYILSVLNIKPSNFLREYKHKGFDIKNTISSFKKKKIIFDDPYYGLNNKISWFDSLIKYIDKNNIDVINISEKGYPLLLKDISYPPPVLFVKGAKIKEGTPKIAVVGTRKMTIYGRDAAIYISGQLSKTGITIVSGMASGIDYYSQKSALKEKGGSIGVIGCGIDITYPYENRDLYDDIIENGSIITEYFPGKPPLKNNFPARNRIISGMSMGVVVVEAQERSGALITSNFALEQNREVFAVPGSIFSKESMGCNNLIKNGAKLVEDIDDILEEIEQYMYDETIIKNNIFNKNKLKNEFNSNKPNVNEPLNLGVSQKKVYDCIGYRPKDIEEIVSDTGLNTYNILQILSELQLKDLIIEKNSNEFVRM